MATIRVDSKGRLMLPKHVRDELGIEPGDTVFVEREGKVLRLARAENPFDTLAREALEEHRRGETIPLAELKAEFGKER